MNKELEAFEKLKLFIDDRINETEYIGYLATLKSALERKEKLEKAWEIVKEKRINVYNEVIKFKDYKEHKLFVGGSFHTEQSLTETEFNLLKEILEEK